MTRRLRWSNPPSGMYNVPAYLAGAALAEQGIELDITDNVNGPRYADRIVAGDFDLGQIGTPPFLPVFTRRSDIRILGTAVLNVPTFHLVAAPAYRSIRDLVGQRVAVNEIGSCPHSLLLSLCAQHGLAPGAVTAAPLGGRDPILKAVERGEIAGAVIWEPYASYVERTYGWNHLSSLHDAIQPANYCFVIWCTAALWQDDPGTVRQVVAAYTAGVRQAVADPAAAARLCADRLQVAEADLARAVARELPLWNAQPAVDWPVLNRAVAEVKQQGLIPADLRVEDYVIDAFALGVAG